MVENGSNPPEETIWILDNGIDNIDLGLSQALGQRFGPGTTLLRINGCQTYLFEYYLRCLEANEPGPLGENRETRIVIIDTIGTLPIKKLMAHAIVKQFWRFERETPEDEPRLVLKATNP